MRGIRVRTDGVELATAPEVAEVPGGHDEHDHGDDREDRDAEEHAGSEATEVGRHVGRVDAVATCPGDVDAAIDVQRAEGDDERGYLREGDECAVHEPEDSAEADAG